jgi:uncharacterized membrane protein YkoI
VKRRTQLAVVAGLAVAALGATASVAIATARDDDQSLTGQVLDRAKAAALQHTGGGEVTETEAGDDGAAYGVEVKLADGRQVEVELDKNFAVVGSENDEDGRDGKGDD